MMVMKMEVGAGVVVPAGAELTEGREEATQMEEALVDKERPEVEVSTHLVVAVESEAGPRVVKMARAREEVRAVGDMVDWQEGTGTALALEVLVASRAVVAEVGAAERVGMT